MDINNVNTLIVDPNTLQQNNKPVGSWKKWVLPLIYLLLVLVVVYEVYVGVTSLSDSTQSKQSSDAQSGTEVSSGVVAPVGDAILALIVDKTNFKVGEKIPVVVQVSTTGKIISRADVVIKYDPKILSIGQNSFTNGLLFSANPLVTNNALKGMMKISGDLGSPLNGFNGIGNLGTVTFTAKAVGSVLLTVDYTKDLQTDSNVIDFLSKEDILGQVYNVEVEIK